MASTNKTPRLVRFDFPKGTSAKEMAAQLAQMMGKSKGKSIDDEIGSIEKMMRENRPAYNKSESTQARYRELLDARRNRSKK